MDAYHSTKNFEIFETRTNCTEIPWRKFQKIRKFFKALANEDTLLRTHCFRHKCFSVCPRATFVADTNFVSGTQKLFLILFRNILCPQQMLPSLRSPRNIMGNIVSATMCPRLPGPLISEKRTIQPKIRQIPG